MAVEQVSEVGRGLVMEGFVSEEDFVVREQDQMVGIEFGVEKL